MFSDLLGGVAVMAVVLTAGLWTLVGACKAADSEPEGNGRKPLKRRRAPKAAKDDQCPRRPKGRQTTPRNITKKLVI